MNSLEIVQKAIETASSVEMQKWFDRHADGWNGIVVAGASGFISNHVSDGLRRLRLGPLAFADNNVALCGTFVEGIPVLSPKEAVNRYPDAVFVAAIFTHTPLRQQLKELGATRVVSYAQLFHKFPAEYLPYFALGSPRQIAKQAEAVRQAATIWADDESRQLYAALVNWFITLESEAVPPPLSANLTYFPEFLKLRPDEVFADCGAFSGDTITTYLKITGRQYGHIFALEPDPDTFQRLIYTVHGIERITCLNVAVGRHPGTLSFVAVGSLASRATTAGADGVPVNGTAIQVEQIRLDDLRPRPTYVKMDIEGFEQEALRGASGLLRSGQSAFAVTLYHRMADLWNIPLYIRNLAPELSLFLRHYAEDWSETVCYAVPNDRVSSQTTPA